ncbi:hypothetical protein EI94DRAFT_1731441 [Lactarius quietus]|nr:hypothetical protein EI94DRAFT_1731441 [Lactarius quietus]
MPHDDVSLYQTPLSEGQRRHGVGGRIGWRAIYQRSSVCSLAYELLFVTEAPE